MPLSTSKRKVGSSRLNVTKSRKPKATEAKCPDFNPKVCFSKEVFDACVQADLLGSPTVHALADGVRQCYISQQLEALTSKYVSSTTDPAEVRWGRAMTKFRDIETHVARFNALLQDPSYARDLLNEIRHDLEKLPRVEEILPKLYDLAVPGPGSNVGRVGQQNALAYKVSVFATSTYQARKHIPGFLEQNPALAMMFYANPDFVMDSGYPCPPAAIADELFAAPKNAEIDRVCGKQSDFVAWLQLGCGAVLADVLLRDFGVDIRDQSRGWERARQGSIDGTICTIDLSSASDCVALMLARRAFPADWYELLLSLRHTHYEVDGTLTRYEKLSSMGNGYTFAVESLIFAAIVRAVSRMFGVAYNYAVYGDDIVCPTAIAPAVLGALRALGFLPNPKKTFVTGPFRETCGKDFYCGENVRPWFIKKEPRFAVDVYILHNIIAIHHLGKAFPRTRAYLRTLVPSDVMSLQPFYYGAGDAWEDWDEWVVMEASFGFMVSRDDDQVPKPAYHDEWQTPVWKLRGLGSRLTALTVTRLRGDVELPMPIDNGYSAFLFSGRNSLDGWRASRWVMRRKTVSYWPVVWG